MLAQDSKKAAVVSIGLLVVTMLVAFFLFQARNRGNVRFGIEPRYDGHSLSYLTEHAYRYNGSQRLENADTANAIRRMGDHALPFLTKWIATMNHSSQGTDYENLGLNGFRILGSAARPAIPDLINVIGRNNNWPESALLCVGTNAIPALIEFAATNQTADTPGDWRRGIPSNLARQYAIETLNRFGTNAEAALPILLKCYRDEMMRSRADVASAMASVGHNYPERVVPALIEMLTNYPPYLKFSAVEGLESFGHSATSAVPELIALSHDSDPQMQIAASVALKRIAPETPDALVPLIANLNNQESWLRRNAIFGLESLGTNGLEALPALEESAQNEPDVETRAEAVHCVTLLETNTKKLLPILRLNISSTNELVASDAAQAFGNLAKAQGSAGLFLELLFESKTNRHEQVRSIAESNVYEMLKKQPALIVKPLGSADFETYSIALNFLDGLRHDALVIDRKEPEPSTNFHAYVMREMNDEEKARFHEATPLIAKRLGDKHLDVRIMATNILLGLDPSEAKKAGVSVVPPYSFYTH